MSERLYSRPCAVCSCQLDITLDMMTEDITIRAHNLEPRVKECLEIVSHYRRVKGLGSDWRAKHEARGIIYARQLIQAAGPLGGAQERCLGLISWLKESGRDFDLGSAAIHFGQYEKYLKEKNSIRKCCACVRSALPNALVCADHSWCYRCDDAGRESSKKPERLVIEKSTGHPVCADCGRHD